MLLAVKLFKSAFRHFHLQDYAHVLAFRGGRILEKRQALHDKLLTKLLPP
jgi:hypothetical protein